MRERCLVCSAPSTDEHHWPKTRRYGDATVPLCRECHTKAHWADRKTIDHLIAHAPAYWRRVGEWDVHRDSFETWMERRRVRAALDDD